MKNSMEHLEQLTQAVAMIARQAGEYIASERLRFAEERVERKHAHDYVSYVDRHSEELIVGRLKELMPEAGFVTEEGTATMSDEQWCWVVDPLDGTTNFIHSFPPYCVSIALCQGREIMAATVYEVTSGECYSAWRGGGAWMNGKPLRVSTHGIEDALLCLQLPYNSEAYKPVIERLIKTFYGRAASVRMMGSAAMALCYVAAGRLDGYVERYIGRWDYMAGALIVQEAGGRVTDFDGRADFTMGDSVVATNGKIHQEMTDVLACR